MDAEDLVQEALIRLATRWAGIKDPDAYVRKTLANLSVDHHRRRVRWRALWPTIVARATVAVDPPSVVVDAERDATVLLASLPTRQRQVLALFYLGDASELQIAAALGCSVGTVKTHLSRGLGSLRASLTEVSLNDAERSP